MISEGYELDTSFVPIEGMKGGNYVHKYKKYITKNNNLLYELKCSHDRKMVRWI